MDLSTLHLLINLHHLQNGRVNLDDMIKRNLLEQNVRHSLGGIKSILKPIPRSRDTEIKGIKRPLAETDSVKGSTSQQRFGKALQKESGSVSPMKNKNVIEALSRQDGIINQHRLLPMVGNETLYQGLNTSSKKSLPPQLLYAERDRSSQNLSENVSRIHQIGFESLKQSPDHYRRNSTNLFINTEYLLDGEKNMYQNRDKAATMDMYRTELGQGCYKNQVPTPICDSNIRTNCSKETPYSGDDYILKVNSVTSRTSDEYTREILSRTEHAPHDNFDSHNLDFNRVSETIASNHSSVDSENVWTSKSNDSGGILRHCLNNPGCVNNSEQNKFFKLHELANRLGSPPSNQLSHNNHVSNKVHDFPHEHLSNRAASGLISLQRNYDNIRALDVRISNKHEIDDKSMQEFRSHQTNVKVLKDCPMTGCGKVDKHDLVGENNDAKYQIPVPLDSNSNCSTGMKEMEAIISSLMKAQTFFQIPPFVKNKELLREKHTAYILSLKDRTSSISRPSNCDKKATAEINWLTGFVENTVMTLIKFAKDIPGFKDICLQDQAKLLKCSKSESLMSGGMICVDKVHKIMTMPDGHHCNFDDLAKALSKDFVGRKIDLVSKIDGLKLSDRETAILRAITVVFPDRCVLEDRSKVEVIYRKLLDCLVYEVRAHHVNVEERVKQIFDILNYMKDISKLQRTPIQQAFESEGVLESKPLIAEFMT